MKGVNTALLVVGCGSADDVKRLVGRTGAAPDAAVSVPGGASSGIKWPPVLGGGGGRGTSSAMNIPAVVDDFRTLTSLGWYEVEG